MDTTSTSQSNLHFTETEKKQLIIFTLIAYAIPYLFGIYMWYASDKGGDLSAFPNAQMFYPAAGAMLAILITRKEDNTIPKRFFISYIIGTILMILMCFGSMLVPDLGWALLAQYPIIILSILGWIFLLTEKKVKREAYGLRLKKGRASAFCVVLFFLLYILRTFIACLISNELGTFTSIFTSSTTYILLVSLLINFFLVFIAFFGEEYGWRYFLQPLLQKRFGKRWGVILLGCVWAIWHAPIDYFYYAVGYGTQALVSQFITCITLGIFFAYAYMKTNNIWVPVILHFMNNNLVPIISQNYSADVLENQVITWSSILPALILNGVIFGVFLLAKEFRAEEVTAATEVVTQEADETTAENDEML